jgi:electron transfer flavoprotein beta subunit
MNIIVPIKQVPDLVEELEINEDGTDLNRDAVKYKINEFDDHALEEALQLRAEIGGNVTVLALDGEEIDKILYTAIAKGADKGVKITGDFSGGVASHVAARAMANVIGARSYDLILTGNGCVAGQLSRRAARKRRHRRQSRWRQGRRTQRIFRRRDG